MVRRMSARVALACMCGHLVKRAKQCFTISPKWVTGADTQITSGVCAVVRLVSLEHHFVVGYPLRFLGSRIVITPHEYRAVVGGPYG